MFLPICIEYQLIEKDQLFLFEKQCNIHEELNQNHSTHKQIQNKDLTQIWVFMSMILEFGVILYVCVRLPSVT